LSKKVKTRTAFAHFDRTLGAEHRRKTEAEIEAGAVEVPKTKTKPATKMGRPRGSTKRTVVMQVEVPTRFLACAAVVAHQEGVTTSEVATRWLMFAAEYGMAPDEYVEILAKLPGAPWEPYMKAAPGETPEQATARKKAAVEARWPYCGDRPPMMECLRWLNYIE
jgi:hypothetical protein